MTHRLMLRFTLLLVVASLAGTSLAQEDTAAADLPVTRLVLFTSGVGYFEHEGTVSGSQVLELTVGTDDMDDVLQSLVLQDLDGGTVRPVRYPSRDPLGRILSGYALDLTGNPSLAELLVQARGSTVSVQASAEHQGALVNVEQMPGPEGVPQVFLTLHTPDGLVRVPLTEVRRLRFTDPALQAELEAALGALATHRSENDRTLRIEFAGEGERRVRIGYVRAMPVWKTSYRLVLDDDGRADLQGWAIVDNPTETELRDVRLTFVAGQPISFVTALYEPVYADRPRVEVSTAPSVVPPLYQESFAGEARPDAAAERAAAAPSAADGVAFGRAAPQLANVGVDALAQGARTGATFAYAVTEPVTVGRYESALVPIVSQEIAAERLAIYTPGIVDQRPLRGIRIDNDTGLHLAAGTLTVFDAGGFTGNARMADLLPGGSRILTFAVDLETSVSTSSDAMPEEVTRVAIVDGVLTAEVRSRTTTRYRVDRVVADAGFLVLEHPKRNGFQVVSPEPAPAETDAFYRFGIAFAQGGVDTAERSDASPAELSVPTHAVCGPEAACVLEVVMERLDARTLSFGSVTPDQIGFWLQNVELSDEDRETLQRVRDLKQEIVALDREIAAREARLTEIAQEQNRIRQNMGALDRNSSLYRRYVADLEEQEDEIDALRADLDGLRAQRSELQGRLDELLRSLAPN